MYLTFLLRGHHCLEISGLYSTKRDCPQELLLQGGADISEMEGK